MTGDVTNTILNALRKATEALHTARRRIESLDRENRKLRRQLNVKTQREEIHEQLQQVDAEWRIEASQAGVNPLAMDRIYAKRRALEQKLARLDGRRTK